MTCGLDTRRRTGRVIFDAATAVGEQISIMSRPAMAAMLEMSPRARKGWASMPCGDVRAQAQKSR